MRTTTSASLFPLLPTHKRPRFYLARKVNTALPMDPVEADGFINMVKIKHKTKKSHTIKLIVMEKEEGSNSGSSRKFKNVGYHEIPKYDAEPLKVREIVVSPPLAVKKGQFIGVSGSSQLDLCSVNQSSDASVKGTELFYGVSRSQSFYLSPVSTTWLTLDLSRSIDRSISIYLSRSIYLDLSISICLSRSIYLDLSIYLFPHPIPSRAPCKRTAQ